MTRMVSKNIPGIQLVATEDRPERLGLFRQLPETAKLEICGDGFDDRTVKVRWLDSFYFVFRQDLEVLNSDN